ncbi:MAG: hypothetical protein O7F70_01980 [Gemmatimonadetes bacterium]|nr:hypothetical protein [Gemmatimonadota bacterium]
MNKSKLAAGGLLIAVFAAGLIVGGTGSAALEEREQREERPSRTPYIETLQERMGLSPDQRQQIEVVLEEFNANWRTMRQELREEERRRIQEIRVDARSKIIAPLDSSQADVYRQMLAHTDSVRAARASRRQR